jgi:hypothetical protein
MLKITNTSQTQLYIDELVGEGSSQTKMINLLPGKSCFMEKAGPTTLSFKRKKYLTVEELTNKAYEDILNVKKKVVDMRDLRHRKGKIAHLNSLIATLSKDEANDFRVEQLRVQLKDLKESVYSGQKTTS